MTTHLDVDPTATYHLVVYGATDELLRLDYGPYYEERWLPGHAAVEMLAGLISEGWTAELAGPREIAVTRGL